jgi:hypothetical protein
MSRWLLLTAFSMVWSVAGCTASVQPGLANVPRGDGLGAYEDGGRDVVANGDDSCGRYAEQGPLRGRWPPCRTASHRAANTELLPVYGAAEQSLVLPWLEHFYVGWRCAHGTARTATKTVATATTSVNLATSCGDP